MRLFTKPFLAMLMLMLTMSLVVAAPPAFALDLDSAKAQGLVGEQLTGYIGIVTTSPTPELKKMVDEINLRRRASYQAIASKTAGATLNAVEKLAAEKLIAKTSSGHYVETAPGKWTKKP